MGIDGVNRLHIRGPKEVLDVLQKTQFCLPIPEDSQWKFLLDEYFRKNAKIERGGDHYLYIRYDFRNQAPTDYLTYVLEKYPQLWMKNEYDTEEGYCGIWVARMYNGIPSCQTVEWIEPCIEEMMGCEDFSVRGKEDIANIVSAVDEILEEALMVKPIKKRVLPVSK
jgi:hypothetical protein